MQASILKKVLLLNRQHSLFSRDARLLVGVSGGSDSTALLSILRTLKREGHVKDLVCVHFNHGLRDQADHDQAFVEGLASAWAIPCIVETRDIKAQAGTKHCSIETAGRHWRLERLLYLAQAHQCEAIATGHHLDDNAETMIHRLSRGTGYRGLCGIRPIRLHQGRRLISPLRTLTRQDIRAYLVSQKQSWCEDATNQDTTHTRNFIRQITLPELSKLHPELPGTLSALSLRCHDLYVSRIEPRARVLLDSHVQFSKNTAVVTLKSLSRESNLVLVDFIRQVLTGLGLSLGDVTQYHYGSMIDLIHERASNVNLPGEVLAVRDQGTLRFLRPNVAPIPRTPPVELALPGSTRFGSLRFLTRILDVSHMDPGQRANPHVEYLDLEKLALPLYVRARAPGDRFIPLGRSHAQKVGKLLSRARIKTSHRNDTVILCDDQQAVLWVCPVRICESARITEKTREVLEIRVSREV